jgi:crotonobetainyl-CoA:carnitine CoA-transferase CaiB-like acyl-CoA transferase
MLDCLLAASALQTSEYWGTGRDPQPLGSAHPRNAPYQAFRGSDRYFVVAAGSQKLWEAVCAVAGQEHLIDDARFQDQQHRAANQGQLAEILQQVFVAEPAEFWVSKFAAQGVPTSFVARFSEILSDDHVTQSGLLDIVDVPVAGPTPMINFPVRFGQERGQHRPPPRLGEHTDEVTAEWAADE